MLESGPSLYRRKWSRSAIADGGELVGQAMAGKVLPYSFCAAAAQLNVIVRFAVLVRMTADLNGRERGMTQLVDQLLQCGTTAGGDRGVVRIKFDGATRKNLIQFFLEGGGGNRKLSCANMVFQFKPRLHERSNIS